MEEQLLSSSLRVDAPSVADLLLNSRWRRILLRFAREPLSVSDAAALMNMDLKRTHYHVHKLTSVGLLKVERIVRRPGRAIKYYRAVAEAFFVPNEIARAPSTHNLAEELRERLREFQFEVSGGVLFFSGPDGEPIGRIVASPNYSRNGFELWKILRLSATDFQQLHREMEDLLAKYRTRVAAKGAVHLIHCAGVRRAHDSGTVDNVCADSLRGAWRA